jgi:hypothetical protein
MLQPEFVAGLKAKLDAMPEAQRNAALMKLGTRSDVTGRAVRQIANQYAALEGALPATKGVLETRLEPQMERFMRQGAAPETAKSIAIAQAMTGMPGQDLQQMTPDVVGEQAAAEAAKTKKELEGAGFAERVGATATSSAEQAGMGLMNIYADIVGDDEMKARLRGAQRVGAERGAAIPEGEGVFAKSAQQAMATLVKQGPMLALSVLTGTAVPVLASVGIEVFGNEYGQGRSQGLEPGAAATRASLLTAAELVFERFGMTGALAGLKKQLAGNPNADIARYFATAMAKEIPAEQATTFTQFLIDKAPEFGLRPNAGWADLLEAAGETLRQTVIQSGTMAGATVGAIESKRGAERALEKYAPEVALARGLRKDIAERDFLKEPVEEYARRALSPEMYDPGKVIPKPEVQRAQFAQEAPLDQNKIVQRTKELMASGMKPEDAALQALDEVQETQAPPPPPPAPPALPVAPPTPPAPPVDTRTREQIDAEAEREGKINTLTNQYIQAGWEEADARKRATAVIDEQAKPPAPAGAPAPETPAVGAWPTTLLQETLKTQLAKPEDQRKAPLIEAIRAELTKRAQPETPAEGTPSAAKPVEPAVGEGVSVAGKPSTGAPAQGAGVPPTGGVVPTEPDVGQPPAGAGAEPPAVKKPSIKVAGRDKITPDELRNAEIRITDEPLIPRAPAPEPAPAPTPAAPALTYTLAVPAFFDSLGIAPRAPIRDRLADKELTDPEVREQLKKFVTIPNLNPETKQKVSEYLRGAGTGEAEPEVKEQRPKMTRGEARVEATGETAPTAEELKKSAPREGDTVRVGNTMGVVIGVDGDYVKVQPNNAVSPKAYHRVNKKNVEIISRPNLTATSAASKQQFGSEDVKLQADMGNLIKVLGASMYAANVADVAVKELLQNAFDAVKGAVKIGLIKTGDIKITLNSEERTITVSDNARGMTPDIIKSAFFTVGGTSKTDLDPSERSGGLGLAKMGFMLGSDWLKLDTVRDGMRTTVDATAEEIAGEVFQIKKEAAPKSEHGTTVTVKIPENYTDPKTGQQKTIYFPWGADSVDVLQQPLLGPTQVTVEFNPGYGDPIVKVLDVGVNFNEKAIPKLTTAHFSWGDADIYFGVEHKKYPTHKVLSSGVYQFNKQFNLGMNEVIPHDIIINVKPNVIAQHPDYPFENSRERFKVRIDEDIKALQSYLAKVARGVEAEGLQESFKGIVSMPRIDVGADIADASKKLKKAFDKTAAAPVAPKELPPLPAEIFVSDKGVTDNSGKQLVTPKDNKKEATFTAEKAAPDREQFMLQMQQDPSLPIFHNNTNVDFLEIGEAYGDPKQFFAELGTLMVEMKESAAGSGLYGYDKLDPKNLFFAGISIDKGYGGVHIKVPYKAVLLNPFYDWGARTLFGVREHLLNTMIHEIAHTGSMDHGVAHNTQMVKVGLYLADQGLMDYYRDALLDILTRHESTFTAMREAYGRSTTKNTAKSLEDYGKSEGKSSAAAREAEELGDGEPGPLSARAGQGGGQAVPPAGGTAQQGGVGGGTAGPTLTAADTRTQQQIDADVDAALAKVRASAKGAEQLSRLYALRDLSEIKPVLSSILYSLDASRLDTLLPLMTADTIAEVGGVTIPELKNTNKLLSLMRGMEFNLMEAAGKISDDMVATFKQEPGLRNKLMEVVYTSTLEEIDPTVDKRSAKMNKMYADLSPEGKRLYKGLKQYYESMVDYYSTLLDDQINNTDLPASARSKLLAEIKKLYEADKRIVPYFPLVRNRGDLWLRVGKRKEKDKKKERQFYTFASTYEREALKRELAKDIAQRTNRPIEEVLNDENEFDQGDTLESFRKETSDMTAALTKIFGLIDAAPISTGDPAVDRIRRDKLKDSIYQLYLNTLPDQSFRTAFIKRKGITGFNTDLLRNFSTTAIHMSSQLARIKYGTMLRNSLVAADKSLEGNPEKSLLVRYQQEMARRVDMQLNPYGHKVPGLSTKSVELGSKAVDLATRASFIYYLSAAGSALVQLSSLPYGAALLGARHGYAETAREMTKLMKFWDEFGLERTAALDIKRTLGVFPTISMLHSKAVFLNGNERKALKAMARGTDATMTGEILERARVPSIEVGGVKDTAYHVATTITGGLFSNAERITREILFLTSYRLAIKKAVDAAKAANQDVLKAANDAHEAAIEQAIEDTHDSAGNMAVHNRPPLFQKAAGRFVLQFAMYPLFITTRLVRTFFQTIKPLPGKTRWLAFKEFSGILGVTGLLAGASGLPMFSVIMGLLGAMANALGDEDKPKTLKQMDYELWWRTELLPEKFGHVTIGGTKLSDIIDRGPINAFTGVDIASRTSLNDLWFRDTKETRTPREGFIEAAIERAGPSLNLVLTYLDAYKAFQDGDMQKAAEKFLPAIARGPLVAWKYAVDAIKDNKGTQLLSKDAYTLGDFLFQSMGLRIDEISNAQNVNYRIYSAMQKVKFEREDILKNLRESYLKQDTKRFKEFMTKRDEFNRKYPDEKLIIEPDDILRSIESAAKARGESYRGLPLTETDIKYFGKAALPSRQALEAKEQRARQ